MKWIESSNYFCATYENGRDVATQYVYTPFGYLLDHKFIGHAAQGEVFVTLLETSVKSAFLY